MNPSILKKIWDSVGDSISGVEKKLINATGDKWITLRLDGARKIMEKTGDEKLQWLYQQNLLPLTPHQAYGTFVYRYKSETIVTDRLTGIESKKMKWVEKIMSSPILVNFKNGLLKIDELLYT
jgi:hypothetical protein